MQSLGQQTVILENILREALLSEFRTLHAGLLDELLDAIPQYSAASSSPWRMYLKSDVESYLRSVLFPTLPPSFELTAKSAKESELEVPQIYSQKQWEVKKRPPVESVSDLLSKLFKAIKSKISAQNAIECSKYLKDMLQSKDPEGSGEVRLNDVIELFYEKLSQQFQDSEFTALFLYFRRMAGIKRGQEKWLAYPFLLHNIEQSFSLFIK